MPVTATANTIAVTRTATAKQADDTGAGKGSTLDMLQRRLRELTKQLQETMASDMDAAQKDKMVKILQEAIKQVQQQIAEAMRKEKQDQQAKAAQSARQAQGSTQQQAAQTSRNALPGSAGGVLDTFA
ncbi:FlxA-like family protein [Uliginosibacterium gangwonense]|uniref:FlxA-like family protein n=1 Tax=Uliginosibacterium gangwonense TaxID=392736 RepID=UPI0012F9BA38|nr:FlxA-like family protein [Uliginosibacterium gangwonense]